MSKERLPITNNFQPIEITFICETEDDLRELWHRFNVSMPDILEDSVPGPSLSEEHIDKRTKICNAFRLINGLVKYWKL